MAKSAPPPLKIVTYVLAVSLAATAWATDFVWTGNTQYAEDWFDSDNWELSDGSATETYPQAGDTATFNKDASLNVDGEITVGTLVLNATVTHKRDKWLNVGAVSGSGTLVLSNRGRLRNISGTEVDFPCNLVITNSDATACSDHLVMPLIQGNGATFTISGYLKGDGHVFLTMSGTKGVVLAGDNSGFSGTVHIDSNTSNRMKFASADAGSTNATWILHGNTSDNGSVTYNDGGTIKFGSFKADARTTGNYPWRFKDIGSFATVEIGHLNAEDDIISVRMGENSSTTGMAKIRKVGTGTLELWHTGHQYGTEIAGGTVLATSVDALNGRTDSNTAAYRDASTICFTGGTLAYGTDEWTDSENPVAVTTDWSSIVKDSTSFISVDTGTNEVTWASSAIFNNNSSALGFVKKGEGTLSLPGSNRDGTWKFFISGAYTNTIEEGSLEIANLKYNTKTSLASKFLGAGTLRILSEEANGGYRLYGDSGQFDEFEGTVEWASTNGQNSAVGFMMNNAALNWPNIKFRITGAPEEATNVMACETKGNSSYDKVIVDAFDHLSSNAVVSVNRAWALNILGTAGDSYLNGTFAANAVTITKTGAGKLTMGPGFSAPEGSTINVNEGVFAMDAGMTAENLPSYLTIASGVQFTGDGVFGDVDLSVNDVVEPDLDAFEDTTQSITLLTATSITGTSATMTALLETVNAGDTQGKWVVTKVANDDDTVSLQCGYRKNGLTIIFR